MKPFVAELIMDGQVIKQQVVWALDKEMAMATAYSILNPARCQALRVSAIDPTAFHL